MLKKHLLTRQLPAPSVEKEESKIVPSLISSQENIPEEVEEPEDLNQGPDRLEVEQSIEISKNEAGEDVTQNQEAGEETKEVNTEYAAENIELNEYRSRKYTTAKALEDMERKNTGIHKETVRLNRYLAMAGIGSRRKNDDLILSGAVKVNGHVVSELGIQVKVGKDKISINGELVNIEEKLVYILMNKPKDAITTLSDEKGRTTVMKYLRTKERIFPVGRLDRNTTGVLLFTNDGDLAHALIHPKFEIEKMYRVTLDRQVNDEDLKKLRKGVRLEDGNAKANTAEIILGTKRKKVLLTLREGRNREVRRMFEAIGHDVRQLDRVSFAGLTTLGIPRGSSRNLTRSEVEGLKRLTGTISRKEIDEISS